MDNRVWVVEIYVPDDTYAYESHIEAVFDNEDSAEDWIDDQKADLEHGQSIVSSWQDKERRFEAINDEKEVLHYWKVTEHEVRE